MAHNMPTQQSVPPPFPSKAVTDVRAALQAGHGFPGDCEAFEVDLQRALEASSAADLTAVTAVITDYRGRIRLRQDPGFDIAVREGIDLSAQLKRESRRGRFRSGTE
ncbi:hypothetical protein [Streptomyces lancefieldiae]|uniref:Uncharacterized protein n=1 Tax=Streptomyces lancefieldiae TaxID=3075520 RepID=A0ABU3AT62_9ACTN|nr:hypothetical protein [Streptomyces sp. DSM 40712]MDT0613388.1 hypothetical protein [Streptomyces sp. DSM 40712]